MAVPIPSSRFLRLASQVLVAYSLLPACTPQGDPGLGDGFSDDFERASLGPDWRSTGGDWRIEAGELRVQGARNHPLWLRRTLPSDVRVEFEVTSESPEGDIKVEIFGDGVSAAQSLDYVATSYVVIFGGWNNSLNVLARKDEHGADRVLGPSVEVQPGRRYQFAIERLGGRLSVWIDREPFMTMDDPDPLKGRGHDHFAFNNWRSELRFDNLKVRPL